MALFTIPAHTVPAGRSTFGPFAIAGGFQHVDLTLDIAAITSCDVLVEFSLDQIAWRHVMSETGLTVGLDKNGVPITTEHFVGNWSDPWPAGFVRITLNNSAAFVSNGGSLQVS